MMKLESPVIDLEPGEWRRVVKWFYKGWPPWNWPPFVRLYVLLPLLAVGGLCDLLGF